MHLSKAELLAHRLNRLRDDNTGIRDSGDSLKKALQEHCRLLKGAGIDDFDALDLALHQCMAVLAPLRSDAKGGS